MAINVPEHHKTRIYIGGQWREPTGNGYIKVENPSTGEELAVIPEAGPEDAALAVRLANEAFENGPWAKMTPQERGRILERATELMEERSEELVDLVVSDLGTARGAATYVHGSALDVWRRYAEMAKTVEFEWQEETPTGQPILLRKEPVGTVLAVVPWNGPVVLASLKLVPALLAGCSVIMKPAPETPLAPLVLGDILSEAGVPEGVVSILPGGRDLGEQLLADPGVDMVSFTGGTESGKNVMATAAQNITRVTLELGGKSAAIILDDIDPAEVIPILASGMLFQSGQVCTALSRIIVSENRHAEWREALKNLFESQVIGDPEDPSATFGPLASQNQKDRVLAHIERAKSDGAVLVTGGGVPDGDAKGYFVEPTLFDGVTSEMSLAQEEVFGPVFALMTYRDVDDAIAIANDSQFGLSGAVMTNDISLGVEIGRRIRTGTFSVNGFGAKLTHPFGGFKMSGIGREGGEAGLDTFVELKQIALPVGAQVG
jgi:aldehyde dehydrogenase (NAD+)